MLLLLLLKSCSEFVGLYLQSHVVQQFYLGQEGGKLVDVHLRNRSRGGFLRLALTSWWLNFRLGWFGLAFVRLEHVRPDPFNNYNMSKRR